MIVYGKNGKAVNCTKGASCQRHGTGSSYTTSVKNLNIDTMVTPKPAIEDIKTFAAAPVQPVNTTKFNLFKDDIRVTAGSGVNRRSYTSQSLEYYTNDATVDVVEPRTADEVTALLNNGEGTGSIIRAVYLEAGNTGEDQTFNVVGPKNGDPLIVIVNTGTPQLNIVSGNVIVKAHSAWSDNPITVSGDANAAILVGFDTSVKVKAEGNSVVRVVPSDGSWGLVTSDPGAQINVDKNETRNSIRTERTTVIKN